MFDDEEEFSGKELNTDIERFEKHLNGETIGFIDGDIIESIIDYYLFNSNYSKAKVAAEFGINQLPHYKVFNLRKAQAMAGLGLISDALELVNQIEDLETYQSELLLT
jgi:hypothetical protein